jgi:hypothetical protein
MVVSMICHIHGYCKGSPCPKCVDAIINDSTAVHIFKPMIYNDIAEEPMLIESKKQLKEECSKRGLIAARLM